MLDTGLYWCSGKDDTKNTSPNLQCAILLLILCTTASCIALLFIFQSESLQIFPTEKVRLLSRKVITDTNLLPFQGVLGNFNRTGRNTVMVPCGLLYLENVLYVDIIISITSSLSKRVCHKSVTHPFFVCFCIF